MRKLLPLLFVLLGCGVQPAYPVTPASADESVYKIVMTEGTGTGFVVADGVVLTAGHMCAFAAEADQDRMWLNRGVGYIRVAVVAWEMTPDASQDLCLLRGTTNLGPPMVLAATMPQSGYADTIIGYPHGNYAETHGNYLGVGMTTAASDHGSSGSPAFTDRGVYGVVVRGWPDGSLHAWVTGVAEIKRFLDQYGVPYTVGPYVI